MKKLIIMVLLLISCKKEPITVPPEQQYGCTDNQKRLMDGFITSYLNKQIHLNKTQKAMMMPMLRQEAIKTFCIIKRN